MLTGKSKLNHLGGVLTEPMREDQISAILASLALLPFFFSFWITKHFWLLLKPRGIRYWWERPIKQLRFLFKNSKPEVVTYFSLQMTLSTGPFSKLPFKLENASACLWLLAVTHCIKPSEYMKKIIKKKKPWDLSLSALAATFSFSMSLQINYGTVCLEDDRDWISFGVRLSRS